MALFAVALAGLVLAAVGIAHAVLPRQFTAAQRRQITNWELERRWRALPAGAIFPASVSYTVPGADLYANTNLTLQATRLAISPAEGCTAAFEAPAARLLSRDRCATVLRATYVDSSGSMVATIAVAVLPAGAQASVLAGDLAQAGLTDPAGTFPVPGTSAAEFGDAQRQLASVSGAGPYLVVSTAGFADARTKHVSADQYVEHEMQSFASGLVKHMVAVLGRQPREPVCPGAPGC